LQLVAQKETLHHATSKLGENYMRTALISILTLLLAGMASAGITASPDIKVDQVGYPPNSQKIAIVTAPAETFQVKQASDGAVVLQGKLSAAVPDNDSGDTIQAADFSSLRKTGVYYIEVPGVGRSWDFAIRPDAYSRTYYLAMRAFYGQRCGTAVDLGPEFPGFSHPVCHLDARFHSSSGKEGPVHVTGGWHDAGDYGRYVVNSGATTSTLLRAWEMFGPKLASIKLNIPETGNGTPDILSEVRWNLEWMLKMQDEDGGVWHKQTSERFCGFVMPQDDHMPSEIMGTGAPPYKSSCATANLAAVAAIAARVYAPYDKDFAARSLVAARKAWAWIEVHPNVTFTNPPGVQTGVYDDRVCSDEHLWAAAELWRTTGEPAYNRYFIENYRKFRPIPSVGYAVGWSSEAVMGFWTYALTKRTGTDPHAVADIRQMTLATAREIAERTQNNPYHVGLTTRDYEWGSNDFAAHYGILLLMANAFEPNRAFVDTALDNLHYLLGRNTFSLSFVTQVGSNPVRHPHHRPSGADNNPEPWPGLLAGGPNAARQDRVLASLPFLPPAKIYVDNQDSYASNEIAINWQASLVFLLAGQLP
jgi:endoglucanase